MDELWLLPSIAILLSVPLMCIMLMYAIVYRQERATRALHAYKLHLGQLLEEYDLAQRQLEQIEHELRLILEPIPYAQKLLEIRGIYITNLAGVLGEAGDLSGYTHGNALLRHAGLNLAEASSGKWRVIM